MQGPSKPGGFDGAQETNAKIITLWGNGTYAPTALEVVEIDPSVTTEGTYKHIKQSSTTANGLKCGVVLDTKTAAEALRDGVRVQVEGDLAGVKVESSVAAGDTLVASTSTAGRLIEKDAIIGGSFDNNEQNNAAQLIPLAVAYINASSNTSTVRLLNPLKLMN